MKNGFITATQREKSHGDCRSCYYVVDLADYSRCEGYAVYFVGPGRCYLLGAVETVLNRIPQILRRPIITCSVRWHMVWLISSSAHMKTSKNGLIRG